MTDQIPTSLDTHEGIVKFITELAATESDRVLLQGLQTAALALRTKCEPSDFRLIVPAELLAVVQGLPELQLSEFPDELYAVMVQSKQDMFDVMRGLRDTTQQEILKGLGFYVPCHCGVAEPHEPFTPGVCTLEEQLQMAGLVGGNGADVPVELAPEDDDEVAH